MTGYTGPDELFLNCPSCWLAENLTAPDWLRSDAMVLRAASGITTHGYEGRHRWRYEQTGDPVELERQLRHAVEKCGSDTCACVKKGQQEPRRKARR